MSDVQMPVANNAERILVVDGARGSRRRTALQLAHAGYTVTTAESAEHAVTLIRHDGAPPLAIIDASLPDRQGMALANMLRSRSAAKVLMLCTPSIFADCDGDKQALLDGTAESMLLRPYAPAALLNVVQRLLRSTESLAAPDEDIPLTAALCVNFARRYLLCKGERVRLTPTEALILHALYARHGEAVSPAYLVDTVWRGKRTGTLGSLWVHIRRLRKKLERDPEAPEVLVTVRSRGYALRRRAHPLIEASA